MRKQICFFQVPLIISMYLICSVCLMFYSIGMKKRFVLPEDWWMKSMHFLFRLLVSELLYGCHFFWYDSGFCEY